jgi:aldose 1-epimerase
VLSASATEAEIAYATPPTPHWPFAFEVRQRFVLEPAR